MSQQSVFRYSLPEGETPSEGVIKTIATLEDRDPRKLDTALYSVIDPDALDRVFESIDESKHEDASCIVFEYREYQVTVQSDGIIRAQAPTRSAPEKPA